MRSLKALADEEAVLREREVGQQSRLSIGAPFTPRLTIIVGHTHARAHARSSSSAAASRT